MNCKGCGAPLMPGDEVCSHCGTLTPYGKRVQEAKFKYVPAANDFLRL